MHWLRCRRNVPVEGQRRLELWVRLSIKRILRKTISGWIKNMICRGFLYANKNKWIFFPAVTEPEASDEVVEENGEAAEGEAVEENGEATEENVEATPAEKVVMTLTIGNPVMTVNGSEVNIDAEGTVPVIQNDRTLLPVRAVVEAMGGEVGWDDATNTVTLTYPAEEEVAPPAPGEALPEKPEGGILFSTTIGPVDAGIIDVLVNAYTEKNPDVSIQFLAKGTGKTLEVAKGGSIDMVIVHAKSLEEQFVADGYGTERIDFLYNDYVLVGPKDDPAGVSGSANIAEALQKIADSQSLFISRGDNSGTHVKEVEVWADSQIEPAGDWYQVYEEGSAGNKATLLYTNEQNAYTIIDRATVITNKEALTNLEVLHENDEILLNYITIIPCNPEKLDNLNVEGAAAFIEWLTGEEAQEIIRTFGVDQYGEPLFFPNAK